MRQKRKRMTVGQCLQRQRESKNISLEFVSKNIRINPAFLQALEEDAFQLLPSETYVRGFLQSYAKFIHLDPAEVLGLYRNQVGRPKNQARKKEGKPTPLKAIKSHLSDFLAATVRGKHLLIRSVNRSCPLWAPRLKFLHSLPLLWCSLWEMISKSKG